METEITTTNEVIASPINTYKSNKVTRDHNVFFIALEPARN